MTLSRRGFVKLLGSGAVAPALQWATQHGLFGQGNQEATTPGSPVMPTTQADDGWTHGAQRDEAGKRHPLLVPFDALPPEARQSNRDAVRAIPDVLAIAGYVLVRGDHGAPDFEFPADDLNGLAEHLHELWMEEKAAAGYRPGKPTPEDPRRSEDMAPWEELAEPVRQIDLDLVRAMPRIVAAAGYRVFKVD